MSFEFMTMEEVFIVTWGGTIVGGILLGLLGCWIYKKIAERRKCDHDVS